MINHFTFNGTSTAQLGLIVSGVSIFGAGSRKVEKARIPGRNGDLQIELGGFNNYTVRYTVSITKNFTTTAQQIREWLLESKGYCDLTDTYHPDEIRKACFNSDIEFTTSMLYKYGQASIQFDCLPERYLTTNTPITTTATADTTTDTTLSLSTVPTPLNISLNGNTTQEGTPTPTNPQVIHNVSGDNEVRVLGKNILSPFIIGISINSNNGNEVPSVLGATTDYIPVDYDVNPNYYLSGISSTIHSFVCAYNSNKQFLGRTGSTLRNDIALPKTAYTSGTAQGTGDISFLRVTYYQQGTDTDVNTANNYLTQLEVGSTATTYEPYTAQSYPLYLPVENLLEDNVTVSQNANFTVTRRADGGLVINGTATGTALVVYNFETDQPSTNQNPLKRTLEPGTYHASTHCANTGIRIQVVVSNNSAVGGTGASGLTSVYDGDITVPDGYSYNWVRLILSAGTYNNEVIYPQIEKGTKANAYHPYGTTPIELNKIGTYQDYIYKNGGKWYVHKEIGRYVFIGANEEGWALTSSYTNNTRYSEAIITARTSGSALSNYFTKGTAGTDTTNIDINGSNGRIMITIPNTIASTVNDLKTWLSTHNTEVYYVLATPTNTEITDTTLINQLNNIEKAYSYNGTTNILQVSNDNGFMLEVVSLHGSTFNSNYKGEPIITVNATGLIYLNGEVMEVLSAPVTINCQTMQCYNGVVNMNNEVRVNDFPEIKIGANEVGSSMALTITPNNWRH